MNETLRSRTPGALRVLHDRSVRLESVELLLDRDPLQPTPSQRSDASCHDDRFLDVPGASWGFEVARQRADEEGPRPEPHRA